MIKIQLKCDKYDDDNAKCIIIMDGHANFAKKNDIVCAGASAIAYSLLGFLDNYYPRSYSLLIRDGYLNVECVEYGPELQVAFDVIYIGLLQLAAQYPECIEINKLGA